MSVILSARHTSHLQSITLTKQLNQFEANKLSDKQVRGITSSLKKFAEVARTRLGIQVTVSEVRDESSCVSISQTI